MYPKFGSRFYSICIVLLPILSAYDSFIPGVDLGTLLILVFGLYVLFADRKRSMFIQNSIIGLLLYVLFRTLLIFVSPETVYYSEVSLIFFRTMRFVVLITIVMGVGFKDSFDPSIFIKTYLHVCVIASIFGIVQFLVYHVLGIRILGVFGTNRGIQTALGSEHLIRVSQYRPSSFFLEPSNFAYFIVPCLCLLLFEDALPLKIKQRYCCLGIITAAMIITASSQGVLCMAFIWGIWLVYRFFKSSSIQGILVILVVGAAAVAFFTTNARIQYSISRVFENSGYNAVDARIGGYYAFQSLDLFHKIFGTGFGNYNQMIYYSSYADILFCTGFIGLILVLRIYFTFFRYGTSTQRSLVLASLLLMGGGGIYTASLLCLYWPILSNRLKFCE